MERNLSRRYDTDWLRFLTMLAIFTFHCARFFDFNDWHVKNIQQSIGAAIYVGTLSQWIMPIMFVIAGIGSYYALTIRTGKQFTWERFQRLVIPLVFGIFILIPSQVYYERVSHMEFKGSFFNFYPHYYFEGLYAFGGNFAWMGLHLWFLELLFIFTLLLLPLFLLLKKDRSQRFMAGLAARLGNLGGLILFALPLAAIQLSIDPRSMLGQENFGGWNIVIYLVLLFYGYILASHNQFIEAIQKHRRFFLVSAISATVVLFYIFWSAGFHLVFGSPTAMLVRVIRPLNSWLWILTLLGYSRQYLSFNNRFLQYANEAVMPFYVLHQPVILTIGFFLVRWNMSILSKFLLIGSVSFIIIMLVYELLIKRIGLLRILFGMKPAGLSQENHPTNTCA